MIRAWLRLLLRRSGLCHRCSFARGTYRGLCGACAIERDAQIGVSKPRQKPTQPVLVTTKHRGVFFGYTTDPHADPITLTNARCAVYWSIDVRGFMGLAANGPTASCRIGPRCDITLRDVTSVSKVTPDAAKAWEASPWS